MLIELWRKVLASDYSSTCCAICGNDFDRGTVFPVAFADNGGEIPRAVRPVGELAGPRVADAAGPGGGA